LTIRDEPSQHKELHSLRDKLSTSLLFAPQLRAIMLPASLLLPRVNQLLLPEDNVVPAASAMVAEDNVEAVVVREPPATAPRMAIRTKMTRSLQLLDDAGSKILLMVAASRL